MLDIAKRFLKKVVTPDSGDTPRPAGNDVRVATCALFLEMAHVDESFTDAEMETILDILVEKYDLSREDADALLSLAEKERTESVDLWQFARLINETYTTEEKIEIIETLWRIVYVDGKLDKYENYLMHKLEQLLRLSHDQLIRAKLKVLHPSR